MVKNPPANAGATGDVDSIPGLGRSPGGGQWQSTPVFLTMDRGVWWVTVYSVVKS